jgi:hypothetical protein
MVFRPLHNTLKLVLFDLSKKNSYIAKHDSPYEILLRFSLTFRVILTTDFRPLSLNKTPFKPLSASESIPSPPSAPCPDQLPPFS